MNTKIFWALMFILLFVLGGCTGGCYNTQQDGSSVEDYQEEQAVATRRDSGDQQSTPSDIKYHGAVRPEE